MSSFVAAIDHLLRVLKNGNCRPSIIYLVIRMPAQYDTRPEHCCFSSRMSSLRQNDPHLHHDQVSGERVPSVQHHLLLCLFNYMGSYIQWYLTQQDRRTRTSIIQQSCGYKISTSASIASSFVPINSISLCQLLWPGCRRCSHHPVATTAAVDFTNQVLENKAQLLLALPRFKFSTNLAL